jgi:hypothetical protein
MYENGKMRPVETIFRMGREGIKDFKFKRNLTKIYCKHFCKCRKVPPGSTELSIFFEYGQ